jgi:hypothetical protein
MELGGPMGRRGNGDDGGDDTRDRWRVPPLRPQRNTTDKLRAIAPWRLTRPRGEESCRWECVDGRWVTLTLGREGEVGCVVVEDSTGRRELVGSYEGALALAKEWRTW